jgi:hypothetical protein
MKPTLIFAALTLGITISVWYVGWHWSLAPFTHWPHSVVSNGSESQSDIIKRVMPMHLINPEWLHSKKPDDLTVTWMMAEQKARIVVVFTGWFIVLVLLFHRLKRSPSANLKA